MSSKKIPTPEEVYNDIHFNYKGDNNIVIESIKRYAKEVIKYTLKQAAENTKTITLAPAFGNLKSTVKVNKESILSLEQQIIKDLGL